MHNTGEAVVRAATTAGQLSSSLWRDGAMLEVDDLGFGSFLADVNDDGVAVGLMWDSTGSVAITWDGEDVVVLETLGGEENFAHDITDSGLIAGISNTEDGDEHAVIWRDGAITDLGTLGGDTSDVDFANEAGQVLGSSETSDGATHAFLWQDGTMTDLGLFEGNPITGIDLNDAGQVVGWAPGSDGRYHAILWHDGVVTDLGTGGGVQAWAYTINNLGQIAGIVELEDGRRQIVRWDPESPPELLPVPSPTPSPLPTATATAIPEPPGGGAVILLLDIYFEPRQVTIAANTGATVRLVNEGAAPHSFVIDELGISVSLAPGESADVVINAVAGTYEFYCDVPGHREAGMVGVLVVE
jgi:probable HAF family extracellular repeat protein